MRKQQTTPYDTAAWYILAGVAFAGLSGLLVLAGSLTAPPRDSLQTFSGEVEQAVRACTSRGGCSLELHVRTPAGRQILSQDDFPAAADAVYRLRIGQHVTGLTAPSTPDAYALSFWELSRDYELLLSYDEAAAGFVNKRHNLKRLGYVFAGFSFVALAFGIFLIIRIRRGNQRVAA